MLEREDGTVIENDVDIAKSLNDYFCSVFTREILDNIPSLPSRIFGISLSDIQITFEEVSQQLVAKITITQVCWPRSMSSMCVI